MTQAQTLREQRFARALDREIAPVWHDRFARLIYRHLPVNADLFALDVHCGAGRSTYELLDRLGPNTRVLGLEADETLRGMANARMEAQWKDRVYFRDGDLTDIADMGSDTYDLLAANLVLNEAQDLAQVLGEFTRVVKPGGLILATMPMAGTWAEVEDLFQLVLRDNDNADAARRLRRLARMRKSGPDIARVAAQLNMTGDRIVVEQERFSLLFNSGREFLFSPMVEHGPLRAWKAIVNDAAKVQELFWQLKEAIDAYYADAVFAVTIVAGIVALRVPDEPSGATVALAGEYWKQYPDLANLFELAERGELADEEVPEDEEVDLDFEIDDDPDDDASEEETTDDLAATSLSASLTGMNAEDAAIFALLDEPGLDEEDAELDSLLDQVLEFANTPDTRGTDSADFEPVELAEITAPQDMKTKPGDTLSRIRALLPPPPTTGHHRQIAARKKRPRGVPPPPPPPKPKKK